MFNNLQLVKPRLTVPLGKNSMFDDSTWRFPVLKDKFNCLFLLQQQKSFVQYSQNVDAVHAGNQHPTFNARCIQVGAFELFGDQVGSILLQVPDSKIVTWVLGSVSLAVAITSAIDRNLS